MELSDQSPAQPVQHIFRPPELWVILRTLGLVEPGLEAPPELAAEPKAVPAAQARLLQQGALRRDAAGRLTLAPELEALVRPAAYPETVFIATITDHTPAGPTEREACFSWTPEALVVNWVDETQDHHFAAYHPLEVHERLWDHLSRQCSLEVEEPDPRAPAVTSQAIEQGVEGMSQAVLLMAINRLQASEQTVQTLSWWVSGRTAWLLQKQEQSAPLRLSPAGRADLETAVLQFIKEALKAD